MRPRMHINVLAFPDFISLLDIWSLASDKPTDEEIWRRQHVNVVITEVLRVPNTTQNVAANSLCQHCKTKFTRFLNLF